MNKGLDIKNIFKPVGKAFARFHLTIFVTVVVLALVVVVLLLQSILGDASLADGYVPQDEAGSIDQATLNRIEALHTSDGTLPAPTETQGRANPFAE